ncbi:MAG: multicopper oxidase domain-containing protein [Gemmatimonadaceae bacterium]
MNTASAVLLSGLLVSFSGASTLLYRAGADTGAPTRISTNDNRRVAGTLRDGKLELKLEIVNGNWFPESDSGPSVVMQAFAESGRAPEIPGPMIRVTEGTVIHVTLHNVLPDVEVVVHGLHSRPATADDVISIPPGATREVRFESGPPGTYFYWATTTKNTLLYRNDLDSQLSGAIIVDPRDAPPAKDRTFVIGVFHQDKDSVAGRVPHPREIVVVNGKSWPHTERFTFSEGDTVSWRVVNPSSAPHPMHLHGFYYNVVRSGGEGADSVLAPSAVSQVNTKLLNSGGTMAMSFVPDRAGNWLFHCHLAVHVDGTSKLANMIDFRPMDALLNEHAHAAHGIHEMAGLIIGIHVLPRGANHRVVSTQAPQNLRLLIQSSPRGYNHKPAVGFVLQKGDEPSGDSVTLPGPTLLLEKGRPARITVVNRLSVPTSVHWHGMEIESYPDGVAGWSGMPSRIAPAIQPADSFIAEFTPPRAGTFIYHSHVNELMQTNSGMYGALVVTDPTHPFDPRIDKIILVGGGGPGNIEARSPGMVNGTVSPQLDLEVGTTYRLRIIQIHPQAIVIFRLGTDSTTARWTPVAKDGADLPAEQATARAASTLMGAGETEDFLYTPDRPGVQKLNVQVRLAGWQVPVMLYIRPAAKVARN